VQANRNGRATRWPHDGHFNEAGNEIFADALSEWLTAHVAGPR
jgi:lysophospholipase L1-like esterase